MPHTVNVPNKVGKHRQQLLSQCISTELHLFSSKYLCKQKLQSKPKSEYERKKGTADSGNWRSRCIKYLMQDSILLFRVMQALLRPQWILRPQKNRILRQKLFCLSICTSSFKPTGTNEPPFLKKDLRTTCQPLFYNKGQGNRWARRGYALTQKTCGPEKTWRVI